MLCSAIKLCCANVILRNVLCCHVVSRDKVLYYTAPYCTVLYYTALYCTVLHCTILYCPNKPPSSRQVYLLSKYGLNSRNRLAGMCRVWHDSRYHDLSLAIYPPHSIRGYPDNITLGNYPSEYLCRLSIERHLLVFPLQCTHCTVLHCTVLHCTVLYCNVHTNSGGVNTRLHLALVHSWGADVSPKFWPELNHTNLMSHIPPLTDCIRSQIISQAQSLLDPMFQEQTVSPHCPFLCIAESRCVRM